MLASEYPAPRIERYGRVLLHIGHWCLCQPERLDSLRCRIEDGERCPGLEELGFRWDGKRGIEVTAPPLPRIFLPFDLPGYVRPQPSFIGRQRARFWCEVLVYAVQCAFPHSAVRPP